MSFLVNDPGFLHLFVPDGSTKLRSFLIGIILNEVNASKTETRREKIVAKL